MHAIHVSMVTRTFCKNLSFVDKLQNFRNFEFQSFNNDYRELIQFFSFLNECILKILHLPFLATRLPLNNRITLLLYSKNGDFFCLFQNWSYDVKIFLSCFDKDLCGTLVAHHLTVVLKMKIFGQYTNQLVHFLTT